MQPRSANSNNQNWTNRNNPNGGNRNTYNSATPNNNWRNSSNVNDKPGNSQQNGYKVRNMEMQEYEADGEDSIENKEESAQTDEGN